MAPELRSLADRFGLLPVLGLVTWRLWKGRWKRQAAAAMQLRHEWKPEKRAERTSE